VDISRKLARGLRLFKQEQRKKKMRMDDYEKDFTRLQRQEYIPDYAGVRDMQDSIHIRLVNSSGNRKDSK